MECELRADTLLPEDLRVRQRSNVAERLYSAWRRCALVACFESANGLTVGRLGDDLDPIVECHTENEFWQLVMTVETSPAFAGPRLVEDHRTLPV
jgi:hypothetical protein